MNRVSTIIPVFIFSGLVASFVRITGNEKPVPVIKAELLGWVKFNHGYDLKTKVRVINNSQDTIYCGFWICSSEYRTNTEKLHAPGYGCDTNGFYTKVIPPMNCLVDSFNLWMSNVSNDTKLNKVIKEELTGLKFNIGFRFIRSPKSSPSYQDYYQPIYKKDTILWSNQVEITKDLPVLSGK